MIAVSRKQYLEMVGDAERITRTLAAADAMAKAVEEYRVAQKRMCSVQWDASQDSVTAAAEVYEAADEALDAALSAYRRAGGAL